MDSTESAPNPSPKANSTPVRLKIARASGRPPTPILTRKQLLAWLAISGVFHVVMVGYLADRDKRMAATTAGEAAAEGTGLSNPTTSVERIEQVVEDVREHQAELIRDKVEELIEAQKTLAQADEHMVGEYRAFAEEMLPTAGQEAADAQSKAIEAQKEALAAQDQAAAAQKKLMEIAQEMGNAQVGTGDRAKVAGKLNEAKKEVQEALRQVEAAQKEADAAQTEAAQSLAFAESTFSEAAAAQKTAQDAQREAGTVQQLAVVGQDGMTDWTKRANDTEAGLAKAQEKVAGSEQGLVKAQEKAAEAKANAEAAKAELAAKEAELAAVKGSGDKNSIKSTENQVKSTKKKVEGANKSLAGANKSVAQAEGSLKKAQEALAKAEQAVESVPKSAISQVQSLTEKQAAARAEQQEALAQQESTHAAVKAAQAAAAASASQGQGDQAAGGGQASAGGESTPPTNPATAATSPAIEQAVTQAKPMEKPADLDSADLGELLAMANQAEQNTTEIYREMRAAETATLRKMTLEDARAITDVARPERSALDSELLTKKITTPEEARAHSAAVREAIREIDSMVSLAREMKGEVSGAPVDLEAAKVTAAQNAALEAQAAQDYGQRAKDLSELMRAASQGSSAGGGQGYGGMMSSGDDGSTAMAEAETQERSLVSSSAAMAQISGGATSQLGAILASLVSEGTMKTMSDLVAAAAAAGEHSGGGGPMGGGPQGDQGIAGAAPGDVAFPELYHDNRLNAVPGRKIMSGAVSSPWMFVDTWYIIGPFPNPSRQNIDKQFPPESVVDLDATYRGKEDKMVKWEFVQSGNPMVTPPNGEEYQIFYAYTELWFEEAADRWIAVGSDDYSKLWVEGMLVWKSGEKLKGWNIREGYRKVHFKKGLNRLLYRVENGWHSTQFSLCINLQEGKTEPAQLAN